MRHGHEPDDSRRGLRRLASAFLGGTRDLACEQRRLSVRPVALWDPAKPIPAQLNKNNNNVNMPLPKNLRPAAIKKINSYSVLNGRLIPYHNAVHNALGGAMPNPDTSPSDPIFWPFHSLLAAVYERWSNA
jgi:hypothetical protein